MTPKQARYWNAWSDKVAVRSAQRQVATDTPTAVYLHSDHLGSVSAATSSTGSQLSSQSFDPWGKLRAGGGSVSQTKLNYTGQRLDDTGLLYYHARYYDSGLARFTSPDSIVPRIENSKLIVDFHESKFLSSVRKENAITLEKGFWFQLRDEDRKQAKDPSGSTNPQALNRYAYAQNNPIRYKDPTGHYNYYFNWFIGWVDRGVTPAGAMKELKQHPGTYFPFKITPLNGCTAIANGCEYELDPGVPGSPPYKVRVVNATDTEFTFEVIECKGCFAPVGSTITFKTYESGGATYLQQHGVTKRCSDISIQCVQEPAVVAGAYATWMAMASRLYAHYHDGWPPGLMPVLGCAYWQFGGPCLF